MICYKKSGECVNLNGDIFEFNKGSQGIIYRIQDDSSICLKLYSNDNNEKTIFDDSLNRFTQGMFDYFRDEFNFSSFCKLYDLFYDNEMTTIIGYTMKYYEEVLDNMLFLPTSYLLDNFSLIYDSIEQLTRDCIRVVDLNCDNIINTNNGFVVIDNDRYYRDLSSDISVLNYINKSALMYAFRGILIKSLRKIGINDIEINRMVSNLFTINTSPLMLKCKLRNYTKVVDMFYKSR